MASGYDKEFKLIIKRITKLVNSNGYNFTFKYLKECLRLVVLYLAGTPSTIKGRNACGVRVNQYGLPVIIPSPLRKILDLTEGNRANVRAVLTTLSIFRTFPTKVKPDLASIIEPFHGITRTLDGIERVAKSFVGGGVKLRPIRGFISESAGPITKRATFGAPIDAFALLGYPTVAMRVIQVLITSKGGFGYACSLLSLWLLYIIPFILQKVLFGTRSLPPIGRLSVVYDQAGKARIVAMCNWWIQLSLLPLHKSIFDFLKTIPMDGTFNQELPLKRMMAAPTGEKFSCFDLSSATDRLPLQLQVQILNSIGMNGSVWQELLSFPYFYKGEPVTYSVGQPMGAYSSWAMLALTHHLIVQFAADRVGLKNFTSYAVLGDDIVINNDIVAAEYLSIMKSLGVGINMSKSIVSDRFAEFAKRLVSPTFDISPIGPGNLLQATRRKDMLGSLLIELYTKTVIRNFDNGLMPLVQTLPKGLTPGGAFRNQAVLWTYWMLSSTLMSAHPVTEFSDTGNTCERLNDPIIVEKNFSEEFLSVLRMKTVRELYEAYPRAKAEEKLLFKQVLTELRASKGVHRVYQTLGIVLSPVLYLYWLSLIRVSESIRQTIVDVVPYPERGSVASFIREYTPMLIELRQSKRRTREQAKYIKAFTKEYLELLVRTRSRY